MEKRWIYLRYYRKLLLACLFLLAISFPEASYAAALDLKDITSSLQAQKETYLESYHWSNQLDTKRIKNEAATRHITIHDNQMKALFVHGNAIGNPGDLLVTLDNTIPLLDWAGGHTAIVSNNPAYTVESFGDKLGQNGVRYWVNDWRTRYQKVKALWVDGARANDYNYVASYNEAQVGKGYNYNFFNIWTTDHFYCSQLAWRAWYNRGWDLNFGGLAVWPVDLLRTPYTIAYYSQG